MRRSLKTLLGAMFVAALLMPLGSLWAQESGAPVKTEKSVFTKAFSADDDQQETLFVKADSLTLEAKKRTFTYRGNVEIMRGEVFITADKMVGSYDDKYRMQQIQCQGNVVITRGRELRASSNRATYFVPEAKIVLTEAPELYDRGNALTADRVSVYLDEDRSEAEGTVRVKVVNTEQPEDFKPKEEGLDQSEEG